MAKYVLSWKVRAGGTGQQNHDDSKKLLEAFAKWQMPSDQNFLQFLGRVDGQGGFAVVETNNPAGLNDGPSKFGTWLEFEVFPVLDIMDNVATLATGSDFRESV